MNDVKANLKQPVPDESKVLEDIPGGETNLLPISVLDEDLQITFELWPNSNPSPGSPEKLQLYWNSAVVKERTYDTPINDWDLVIFLPSGRLINGVHTLHYDVSSPTTGLSTSDPTTLTVDQIPPVFASNNAMQLPEDLPALDGVPTITKAYLDGHPAGVPVGIPGWPTPKPGDQVLGFIEWEEDTEGQYPFQTLTLTQDTIGAPAVLTLTADVLETNNNSTRYLSYRLKDRAGNMTAGYSRKTKIRVDVSEAARNLPAVTVVPFLTA